VEDLLGFDIAERHGQRIRGSAQDGIEQSATVSEPLEILLEQGKVSVRDRFIEFVWRHPVSSAQPHSFWNAWYRGFVAKNADKVIESLYEKQIKIA
jgi:hypothetical protein